MRVPIMYSEKRKSRQAPICDNRLIEYPLERFGRHSVLEVRWAGSLTVCRPELAWLPNEVPTRRASSWRG